jgi:ADP-ribose pyrophosphatase
MSQLIGERWHRLSSRLVYKSKYIIVHLDDVKLPDGTIIQYTRVDYLPFVVVVPTILDKIVMIYNYRYPVDEWCLELPSGHIDNGESPQETASRELEEETGYIAGELRMVGWYYPVSARSDQKSYVFIAEASDGGNTKRDRSELQKVIVLPKNTAYQKLYEGEIKHAASIAALAMSQPLLYKHNLNGKTGI